MNKEQKTKTIGQIIIISFVAGLSIAGIMTRTEIKPVGYLTYYEADVSFYYETWEVPRNFEAFFESCLRLFEGSGDGLYICERYEYGWEPYYRGHITDQHYRPSIEKAFETNYEYVKSKWMYSEIELTFSFYSQYTYFHEKTPYNPLDREYCFHVRRGKNNDFYYKDTDCWELYTLLLRYLVPIPMAEEQDWIA